MLILAVFESEECSIGTTLILDSRNICPRERCRYCQKAQLAYPFHSVCLHMLYRLLQHQKLLEDDSWHLRCAQAMTHVPVLQNSQALERLALIDTQYESLQKIMNIVSDRTALAPLLRVCLLARRFRRVSPLLQKYPQYTREAVHMARKSTS
jgi:hypothetical protein